MLTLTEPVVQHNPPLLFDLEKEISESTNIAKDNPEALEFLSKKFRALEDEFIREIPDGAEIKKVGLPARLWRERPHAQAR